MKNINNTQYWNYFVNFIADEFDSGVFDLVIKPNKFLSYENGIFTIISPSKTVKSLINNQFKNKLESFILADSGNSIQINAVLESSDFFVKKQTGILNINSTEIKKEVKISETSNKNHLINGVINKFLNEMVPNKNKTFEEFVVGKSNKMAFNGAMNFANPNSQNNVLFLHGDSGIGKSHLLSSITNKVIKQDLKVAYMQANEFIEFYTSSLGYISSTKTSVGSVDEFTMILNSVDFLIIDDVQGFRNKTASTDTFFNIFEYLIKQGKKIAMASDTPPKNLDGIPERLKTRFSKGLVIKIFKPESELAKKYLENKFAKAFSDKPDLIIVQDVYDSLIYNFGSDFRNLEGIVNKLNFSVTIYPTEIIDNKYITKNILDNPITKGKIKGVEIQKKVCEYYSIEIDQLLGKTRKKDVKNARHLAIYLYRKRLDHSYKDIGSIFGGRDHSTIMHSEKMIKEEMKKDVKFNDFVLIIEKQIFG